MRIDSCRKCGIELCILKYCHGCGQPIQFECKKCQKLTDEQIHFQCMYKPPLLLVS
ncbi:hypothetical protein BD31_I1074 [Candidatus Nitrosopumilus salaria BD31]|uniref:Uncharacterized protein n=1 Tax=Candidatus Nitrosopumilus salarius BD31 TaxID=859350 RepID=I3D047_9ARCH|nr:hypothetical protein BD31_I1074 [Candidatus Nitrosopumilus salaria BD31]